MMARDGVRFLEHVSIQWNQKLLIVIPAKGRKSTHTVVMPGLDPGHPRLFFVARKDVEWPGRARP